MRWVEVYLLSAYLLAWEWIVSSHCIIMWFKQFWFLTCYVSHIGDTRCWSTENSSALCHYKCRIGRFWWSPPMWSIWYNLYVMLTKHDCHGTIWWGWTHPHGSYCYSYQRSTSLLSLSKGCPGWERLHWRRWSPHQGN